MVVARREFKLSLVGISNCRRSLLVREATQVNFQIAARVGSLPFHLGRAIPLDAVREAGVPVRGE